MPGSAAHGGVTAGPRGAALGVEQAGLVRGDDELDPVPGAESAAGARSGREVAAGQRGALAHTSAIAVWARTSSARACACRVMVMARIVASWPGHIVGPRADAPALRRHRGQPLHADHPGVADLVAQRVEVLIREAVVEALEGLPRGELQQHEPVR